jgi:DNA recombination protein RmuC
MESLRTEKGRAEERILMLDRETGQTTKELEAERQRVITLTSDLATARADLANLDDRLRVQKEEIVTAQKRLNEEFQNIANRILIDNSQMIQDQHREKLGDLLNPLKERIEKFEQKVDDTHRQALIDNNSIKEQILQLRDLNKTIGEEARNLTTALKGQSKTQGNWGEIILEKILERSGLARGREYTLQAATTTADGRRQQPDVVIHLPDNKNLVIDSKVSLVAYERYCSADGEEERGVHLKEHIASLRKHIRDLSGKNYQSLYDLSSLDFVLLFVPIEPAFNDATGADPGLYNEAFERNIVIVSQSTLFATLRTIANIWRQENQNRNAVEIARQGGELYDKFVGFIEDLEDLGKKIRSAEQTWDDAMGKLRDGKGNLLRRTQALKALGAKTNKSIPQSLLDCAEEDDVPLLPENGDRP